jgi:hypothetical protein
MRNNKDLQTVAGHQNVDFMQQSIRIAPETPCYSAFRFDITLNLLYGTLELGSDTFPP